ncbi:helix-turn-helix transcriptional regulator [Paraburkholderia phenoliruptrix]|uniref:helix-turn-helix transcriptional regulator n=1 Tax=Paraburkholderia phenoliruptrix TaxID=252970 RepID=UPI003D979A1E
MLNVSRATVYRLVDAGRLTKIKLGHRMSRITADSVDALLATHAGQASNGD